MFQLKLPTYKHSIIEENGKRYIYDTLRKKPVLLTPEEWVRQHMIHYLINHLNYKSSLMSVERALDQVGRADILTYFPSGEVHMIIECKKPQHSITQADLAQLGRYNRHIKASLITITNGIQHITFHRKHQHQYRVLPNIPLYTKRDTFHHSS